MKSGFDGKSRKLLIKKNIELLISPENLNKKFHVVTF